MRDFLFLPLIVALCLVALRHPWIGALAWAWLSIMNPHAYTWAASTMPVAAMVAGSTTIGTLLTSDPRRFPVTPESTTLVLFMGWIAFTYPFSFSVDGSFDMLSKVMKVDFMILMTMALVQTRRQIEILVWVIVLSLGFYGVKGGIFTILTGGAYLVWGPGGFIGGNNEIALALIMTIPLMRYLHLGAHSRLMKLAWIGAMVLTATAALGTQSRGALVAIAAMVVYLWLKSPRKIVGAIAIALASLLVLGVMSESWEARMGTISNYEQDGSAKGRINAWWMTWNLAKDNFMGGGFDIYNLANFSRYAPVATDVHAAHSIYFQVLGEHGFVGLFLFLLMWWFVWRSAGWLIREGGRSEDAKWCSNLGAMCQVSLAGYAVGGLFLSLAYFDLPYYILAVIVLARRWLREHRVSTTTVTGHGGMGAHQSLSPVGRAR